ncbi:MAG: hypothetical protein ACLQMH_15410 [Solirubrobacteraceae bacterium]
MGIPRHRVLALLCVAVPAVGLTACGSTVSTAFKGEQHEVAQAVSNLQTDARNADEQKICTDDLARALVTSLGSASGGCKEAIKSQLTDVDSFDVTIHSIQVNTAHTPPTASASVTSTYSGKTRPSTLLLVKEAGKWKVSGVQ